MRIRTVISTNVLSNARSHFDPDVFCHTTLFEAKHLNVSGLVIDTLANTACSGNHAFLEEFVMGKFITAKVFTTDLGFIENIPIVNVLYDYDAANGETITLEENNSFHLCDNMDDLLLKPIQSEEVGVQVDTHPKRYYPDDPISQLVSFPDQTTIPVFYDGVLLYSPIIRPTKDEVHSCRRLQIISGDPWDPLLLNDNVSRMESLTGQIYTELLVDEVTKLDPIRSKLMSTLLYEIFNLHPILHYHGTKAAEDGKYYTLVEMNSSKGLDYIIPEELRNDLRIEFKTAAKTLKEMTSQFISSTGLLNRRSRTDKSH